MQRWILPAGGTSSQDLTRQTHDVLDPGPGEARIRVRAISINARDGMILAGPFGRTPGQDMVPLSDVAGEIDAVGPEVNDFDVGDRVMTAHVPQWQGGPAPAFGPGPGSFDDPGVAADQIIVDAERLIRSPASLDDVQASTLQVAGVTAWNALFGARPIAAGDLVVVLGSGGVALYAAQLAMATGAEVIAAVRQATDDPRWATLGIADVVSTTEAGWGERLHERTGRAAKVVNSVGANVLAECMAAIGGSGEVALVGLMDLSAHPLNVLDLIGKQSSVRGVAVGSVAMHRDLADFVERHRVEPIIDRRLPFTDLPAAYDAQSAPGLFGKVTIELN